MCSYYKIKRGFRKDLWTYKTFRNAVSRDTENLNDYQLLKEDSCPWKQFIYT